MNRTLPPLNALRAFEAAARLESVSKAAEALNVTPGAVSRQIKILEDWLGVPLFIRRHRLIAPTSFGADYLKSVSRAFGIINAATQPVLTRGNAFSFKICSYPSLTQRWLIPRWKAFYERYPRINIQFVTSMDPGNISHADFDAAICVGNKNSVWQDWSNIHLFDIEAIPVCSPSLVQRNGGHIAASDLAAQTLIRNASRPDDWTRWFSAAGLDSIDSHTGPIFENFILAIQAAIEGIGILIADRVLVADDLASGRLVQPFGPSRLTQHSFYFVFPDSRATDWRFRAFVDWIKTDAEKPNHASP